jgi:Fe-S-cluster-containing dehydrogenase component/CRP-like cAMP-binding protein
MDTGAAIQRPERWDNPFSPDMSESEVDRIMDLDMFREMDTSKFSETVTLRDIIRNDARIRSFKQGDIIVRTGDYGTTAFLGMSGHVHVILPPKVLSESQLGRSEVPEKGFLAALGQLWRNPKLPEVRDSSRFAAGRDTGTRTVGGDEQLTCLRDVPGILAEFNTKEIGPGVLFGEIAALTRSARTTTIFAGDNVEAVEIRRQGIRDIRQRVDSFRENVDRLYRENSLKNNLMETPLFHNLDDGVLDKIAAATLFETYGDFDWHVSYNRYLESSAHERLAMEPVIVREGDYPDGLLIVASGSARVSYGINHGDKTIRYIGVGALFGFEEIAQNWLEGEDRIISMQHTLRAVGYTDVLRVPTSIIETHVLPNLPAYLLPPPAERRPAEVFHQFEKRKKYARSKAVPKIDTDTLEVLVEHRFIKGTATMLIDLDRCVRCDACVEACAKGHNNNPRFIRHGRIFDHYMVANACMHCVDPVCMIGCPTGAIHRNAQGGQVVINDDTCVGCATCATNCPYNNIRMVEVRDEQGNFIVDDDTKTPIVKATKCDLCLNQPGGPACQRACPHDALQRFDMQDRPPLARWLNRP